MKATRLKNRLRIELLTIVVLTTLFLVLFPRRHILLDVALALFALVLLTYDARFTRDVVWARMPVPALEPAGLRGCLAVLVPVTIVLIFFCFGIGVVLGYLTGGWPAVVARVGRWQILLAVGFYLPWALLQQTLFQFYLFGRLLVLLPPWLAVSCTALAYGLVHLPDSGLSAAAGLAGIFWTFMYYRYRRLLPLAVSHACLGAAFHYWIYNIDLAQEWRALLG